MEVAAVLAEHEPEAVKIADSHGLLPSHYAAMRNILPMLSVLVHHPGATGGDTQSMQPLHYAVLHVRVPTRGRSTVPELFRCMVVGQACNAVCHRLTMVLLGNTNVLSCISTTALSAGLQQWRGGQDVHGL